MLESPISNERWHLLYERFGSFQFWLVDEATDEILAEGNSLPVRLDLADLPDRGWEYAIEHATNGDEEPTLVSAIQVLVDRNRHGSGLSALMLGEMRRIAARSRLRRSRGAGAAEPEEPLSADADGASTSPGRPTRGCRSTRGSACTRVQERRSRRSAPSR